MASDLSLSIQEALTSVIETALSGSAGVDILKTYKATIQSLNGLNILVVNTSFVFEKVSTNLKFVLPARTATMIAHAMLMEDAQPLDTISDDIADAMKESITQICGTLQTVINSAGYEDLGKTSFSIGDFEIIDGSNYQVVDTFILFKLSVGEDIFEYFIDFEENFIPFIEELATSDLLIMEENESQIEAPNNVVDEIHGSVDQEDYVPQESHEIIENEKQEEITSTEENKGQTSLKEDENIVDDNQSVEDDAEMAALNKKNKLIKIIVIILGVVLAIVIIGFSALLYMGYFDKEEVIENNVTKEQNITKPSEESLVLADIKNKQIDFKLDMINEQRLNEKLQYLTKYEILEEDVLEKYKKAEAERLYQLRMEKLEEFALNNKEESLYKTNVDGNSSSNEISKKSRFDDDTSTAVQVLNEEENTKFLESEMLMFIKIDPKTYKKYKDVVDKNKENSTQISICKNINGAVDVYVGPLYLKTVINNILNSAKKVNSNSKSDMEIVNITRGDFNKMCEF